LWTKPHPKFGTPRHCPTEGLPAASCDFVAPWAIAVVLDGDIAVVFIGNSLESERKMGFTDIYLLTMIGDFPC